MSDPNHPQDQQSVFNQGGDAALPEETSLDEEIQLIEAGLDTPSEDNPVAPSELENAEDIEIERKRRTVRRERLEDRVVEEEVHDFGFRRKALVAVLAILGLVAVGASAGIAAGIASGTIPMVAGALAVLSGAGGGSVLAYRVYVGAMPAKPEPEPAGEGP